VFAEENNEQLAPAQYEKNRQPGVVTHASMQDLKFRLFTDVMYPPSWIKEPWTRHGAIRKYQILIFINQYTNNKEELNVNYFRFNSNQGYFSMLDSASGFHSQSHRRPS
jgi:hypothetical protein